MGSTESSSIISKGKRRADSGYPSISNKKSRTSEKATNDSSFYMSHKFCGDCPPAYRNAQFVYDEVNRRGFMISGCQPGDAGSYVDLWCLDMATMKWKDLTNALTYQCLYKPERKPLPHLAFSGCTLFHTEGKTFLLLFGGHSDGMGASSRLIIIDLKTLGWWHQSIEGGDAVPRIDPVIVAIGQRLYIFGGYQRLEPQEDKQFHFSYGIAEFDNAALEMGICPWRWKHLDVKYQDIAQGQIFGECIPILYQKKILLTPGLFNGDQEFRFHQKNIFSYHLANDAFQLENIGGDFPRNPCWYTCFSVDPFSSSLSQQGSSQLTQFTLPKLSPGVQYTLESITSSVVICAWVPCDDNSESEATANVWQLLLSPIDQIKCLDVSKQLEKVDIAIQWVFKVDNRLMFFGCEPEGPVALDDKTEVFNAYTYVPLP